MYNCFQKHLRTYIEFQRHLVVKGMYGFENQETNTFQIIRTPNIDEKLSILWTSNVYRVDGYSAKIPIWKRPCRLHILMKTKITWKINFNDITLLSPVLRE